MYVSVIVTRQWCETESGSEWQWQWHESCAWWPKINTREDRGSRKETWWLPCADWYTIKHNWNWTEVSCNECCSAWEMWEDSWAIVHYGDSKHETRRLFEKRSRRSNIVIYGVVEKDVGKRCGNTPLLTCLPQRWVSRYRVFKEFAALERSSVTRSDRSHCDCTTTIKTKKKPNSSGMLINWREATCHWVGLPTGGAWKTEAFIRVC